MSTIGVNVTGGTLEKQPKKVLVTGCCGFIGGHLSLRLCNSGIEVVGIDWMQHYVSRKEKNLSILSKFPNFQFIKGDICEEFISEEFDIIFHLAAIPGVRASIGSPMETIRSNVTGSTNLFDWAAKGASNNVVYASSSSVYGLSTDIPFSEKDRLNSPNSPYASSKVATEIMASTYCRLFPIKAVGLRFFTVYGPRGREDMAIHKFLTSVSEGKPITVFGDGSSSRDYTYVDDIVDGILGAATYVRESMPNHSHEVFNLGNNTPVLLSELIELVGQTVGQGAIIDRKPDQLGDVPITFANIDKASELLAYNPEISLEEGLERTWSSMKNQYD